MASERKIRRYAAYFRGWATAFGDHNKHFDEKRDLSWLLGEGQIGLILTPRVRAFLHPLFLTNREAGPPQLSLVPEGSELPIRPFGSGRRTSPDSTPSWIY